MKTLMMSLLTKMINSLAEILATLEEGVYPKQWEAQIRKTN